ncbi:leucyl aminopeptidase [Candidatus Pelagibacter sp.]|nr:leucyl aminopeptidase [Candidatus Pelagibacter sp.]
MSVQVVYKNSKKIANSKVQAVFTGENFTMNEINSLSKVEIIKLKKIINFKNDNSNNISHLNLDNKIIILIPVKKNFKINDFEILGAKLYEYLKKNSFKKISISKNFINILNFNHFIHGLKIKSYEFNLYKGSQKKNLFLVEALINRSKKDKINIQKFNSIEAGVNFARDLVSEPPNVLYPKEYVNRLLKLKKIGIKVTVYNEVKMKKLGMNSLLGVGRGSSKESYLVTLEYYGNKKNRSKLFSFVGKGVCFDTGGISLKPARFMEEMKYDMAGSAVVSGLMQSLALRKAKINVVGVVGLVENMPGGNAQRPGDIVKSYSGKTIEVLNTDAEGRLVLADALTFTEKKFKPKFIIDLATLTGAIIVSLGEEYAGLFSNNDELSEKLYKVGLEVNEKVWRLPLNKNYDKLINSSIADVQNINYSGGAGSITAAQFLQRFILKNTPWAHLDIAGMAFSKKAANLNPSGATGFGVRLLNQLIDRYYE